MRGQLEVAGYPQWKLGRHAWRPPGLVWELRNLGVCERGSEEVDAEGRESTGGCTDTAAPGAAGKGTLLFHSFPLEKTGDGT